MSKIHFGNAEVDGRATRDWFMGNFLPETAGPRKTSDIEIKWAHHKKGEKRTDWANDPVTTSVTMLVYGKGKIIFRDQTVTLEKEGDYAIWGPGVDHTWEILEDGLFITVRWTEKT